MTTRFKLLGPLEVWHDGARLPVPAGRVRVVLAALLLSANQPVPADTLIEHVWDGAPPNPARARASLQMIVTRLRQALGPANVVRTGVGGYLAEVPPDALDLAVFRELARTGRYAEALDLWRGAPLSDVRSDRLHADLVAPLLEEHLVVVEHRVAVDLAAGRGDGLVGELRALTKAHPLRERPWSQLMSALRAAGRRAEALEVYRELRELFVDELGVEPSAEVRGLHAELLAEDETPAVPARVSRLPRDLPDFTGRTAELATAVRLAESPGGLVCAVDGMAGVGKTAFAVRLAHLVADRFPDGALYIDLHGYTEGKQPREPEDALAVLLYSLGVARDRVPLGLDERLALWRAETAGRRAAVVLDNAFDAAQVRPLLPSDGLVVVTSRRRLVGLDGTHRLSLPVLPDGAAGDLFRRIAARTPVSDETLAELVGMCGHLPLAIRLAAARLSHRSSWTPEYLAERMRDEQRRLTEFSAGDRDVASAFAVSYRTLDPDQQRVFQALGRHVGEDVDRFSAAALAGFAVDIADRALGALVEANLVDEPSPGRFRQHDLVRQYAQRTAAPDDAATRRLLDYYLHVVKAGDELLYPNRQRVPVLDRPSNLETPALDTSARAVEWLEAERENITAAVRHAADSGHDEHAWQIPYLLWSFLYHRGHIADWITTHETAMAAAERLGDDSARARVLTGLAGGYWASGRTEEALRCYLEGLALFERLGDHEVMAAVLTNISASLELMGRNEEALSFSERAVQAGRMSDNPVGLTYALRSVASVLHHLGRYEEAVERFEEALAISRELDGLHVEATCLMELARSLIETGRHEEAVRAAQESCQALEGLGDAVALAEALVVLGEIHLKLGQVDAAATPFERALDLVDEATVPWVHAAALVGVGDVCERRRDHTAARWHWQAALVLYDRLDATKADAVRARLEEIG
ncbi:BTAD domain-containing putative transcriptional regulator [Actinosynnema sp. CA-248983]